MTEEQFKQLKKCAAEGDVVAQAYLAEIASNHRATDGRQWIETQLDMEDEDDDFRPF